MSLTVLVPPASGEEAGSSSAASASEPGPWANPRDVELAEVLARREADWCVGPVVYQVFVDRFAPPTPKRLRAKAGLYDPPRQLRAWDQTPTRGQPLEDVGVWSHELEFWGGDLPGLIDRLDYIESLGADVLYLNPIHPALTNHKYDVHDYFAVAPEFGTRQDVATLASRLHERGMRLMLDGVFNHMGTASPAFEQAVEDPTSRWRQWFFLGDQYPDGFRSWVGRTRLAEINLESPAVRDVLYEGPDSVVQSYLRDGVDGWRLDTAYELGFVLLRDLTDAAHRANPRACVIGEAWTYPDQWVASVDGIMNFFLRGVLLAAAKGEVSGRHAGNIIERMVRDTGLEPLLRSWLVLDNHDTRRLVTELPDPKRRRLAQVLQFTLPGAPVIYYGSELGMAGGDDPANRAPMRWDLAGEHNPVYEWTRGLVELRREHRALRVGGFRLLDTESALAFLRYTDRAEESIIVVANGSDQPVSELIPTRDAKLMSYHLMRDLIREDHQVRVFAGSIRVELPPRSVMVLSPVMESVNGYSAYKRVQ